MVVLAAAICTRNGKALLSRQFVEFSRLRIEGLLAAFPKLLQSSTSGPSSDGEVKEAKQHTYIETDSVRYVYQPIEDLFLLLITNKASNIVEDLETLRLLSKIVPAIAEGDTEEKIMDYCFDLVFAFDEVITTGGYRENITVEQVRINLEMDSHEEKMHKMIQQSKIDSAKDQMIKQSKVIKERQREQMKLDRNLQGIGGGGYTSGGGMTGFGGGGESDYGDSYNASPMGGMGDMNRNKSYDSKSTSENPYISTTFGRDESTPTETLKASKKGMKLGSKKGNNSLDGETGSNKATDSLLNSMVREDNLKMLPTNMKVSNSNDHDNEIIDTSQPIQDVILTVEEKAIAQITRDGAINSLDIKGTLTFTATTENARKSLINIDLNCPSDILQSFNFNLHPKMNKQSYDNNKTLVLKDPSKGFPAGRPVGILRWSLNANNVNDLNSFLPITINCWPEEEGKGKMNVNISYDMTESMVIKELHNVNVIVPLGTADQPSIDSVDGHHFHDASNGRLIWSNQVIDSSNNPAGSIEFTVSGRDPDVFFPILVEFQSSQLYVDANITGVLSIDKNLPIPYSLSKMLGSEGYTVV